MVIGENAGSKAERARGLGLAPTPDSLRGPHYLSIALLPDDQTSTLELFRQHAYAFVTDSTVGIATGIAATVSTRANCKVVRIGSPRNSATVIITATSVTATRVIRTPSDSLEYSFNWWVTHFSPSLDWGPRQVTEDKPFRDLDTVKRSALTDVVRHHPER